MLMNRSVRFGFGGSTVLVVSRGDQVSFNTTVGMWWGGCSNLEELKFIPCYL